MHVIQFDRILKERNKMYQLSINSKIKLCEHSIQQLLCDVQLRKKKLRKSFSSAVQITRLFLAHFEALPVDKYNDVRS